MKATKLVLGAVILGSTLLAGCSSMMDWRNFRLISSPWKNEGKTGDSYALHGL